MSTKGQVIEQLVRSKGIGRVAYNSLPDRLLDVVLYFIVVCVAVICIICAGFAVQVARELVWFVVGWFISAISFNSFVHGES